VATVATKTVKSILRRGCTGIAARPYDQSSEWTVESVKHPSQSRRWEWYYPHRFSALYGFSTAARKFQSSSMENNALQRIDGIEEVDEVVGI